MEFNKQVLSRIDKEKRGALGIYERVFRARTQTPAKVHALKEDYQNLKLEVGEPVQELYQRIQRKEQTLWPVMGKSGQTDLDARLKLQDCIDASVDSRRAGLLAVFYEGDVKTVTYNGVCRRLLEKDRVLTSLQVSE